MNLPQLPKKRKHREADISPAVFNWFRENYPNSCAIEVKIKGGKLKPHQELALQEVVNGQFSYKIPDMGRRICFDGFVLKNADALVVECEGTTCQVLNKKTNETFTIKV